MAKKNAILNENEEYSEFSSDSFDFDDIEEKLQSQLEEEFADLEFLEDEKEKTENPDNLGAIIGNVVWEQVIKQIGEVAGEEFIKENSGLTLDLRDTAHIQTTENFKEGKIANHNKYIDYQKRFDDYQNNFQRNEDNTIKTKKDNRTSEEKSVLRVRDKKKDPNGEKYNTNYDAREYIDSGRPQGSKTVHKDHTISAAEIIRDAEANAHMTREEQAKFANSPKNLGDLDSRANESKGDSKMNDWLNSKRKGEKPADRFPINEDELRNRDKLAREEYERLKKEAEQRSVEAGKKSKKDEARLAGQKALRAVVMRLLAEFVKEIILKLIKWFKSANKKLETLLTSIKEAISSFVGKLKTHLINAADTAVSTIITAITGPVFNTIKKVWACLRQGFKSLKEVIELIKNPENKALPIDILVLRIGEIFTTGGSAIVGFVLSDAIEKALISIPGAGAFFAFEIPLLGSLANILGIFLGAVIAGILGAIVINLIEKVIKKRLERKNVESKIQKQNEILNLQHNLLNVKEVKLDNTKATVVNDIYNRHVEASNIMAESIENIQKNCATDKSTQDLLDDMNRLFDEQEDW